MNKWFIGFVIFVHQIGYSQAVDRQLISTAGESATLNDLIFDWSLGEVVIDQSNTQFAQGFQQGISGGKTIVEKKKIVNCNTIITPGDGSKNETLIFDHYTPNSELQIFDKWGNLLYKKLNYAGDWDGKTNKGIELPDGVYIYILKSDNEELLYKGTITIKRK